MSKLSVSLFGKLQVKRDGASPSPSLSQKAKELLAYLLLHRRAHPREKLATILWQHGATERAKAYLRKALWQLRQSVESDGSGAQSVLRVNGDWIQINETADLWVDAFEFESAFDEVRDCTAVEMTSEQVEALEEAADLYTGDLLENWYQDWCLRHRERLRDILLRMLDRLARCCEREGAYDTGIQYGLRSLRIDPARERTHRQLMRLRTLTGNRTDALRQYERCANVLDRELGVTPATATRRLHEQILNDTFPSESGAPDAPGPRSGDASEDYASERGADIESVRDGLERIRELQQTLAGVQRQIRHDIEAVEIALEQRT